MDKTAQKTNMMPQERNPHTALYAVIIILIFIGLYLIFIPGSNETAEHLNYTQVDLAGAQSSAERLPEGFSRDIPIEDTNITASYSIDGEDAKQYTVEYITSEEIETKYQEYQTYVEESEFSMEANRSDESSASLSATTELEKLIVVITREENGINAVSVTYLQEKE